MNTNVIINVGTSGEVLDAVQVLLSVSGRPVLTKDQVRIVKDRQANGTAVAIRSAPNRACWDSACYYNHVGYPDYSIVDFSSPKPEIKVPLNQEYTAVISSDRKRVVVGCQTFDKETVEQVLAAFKQ